MINWRVSIFDSSCAILPSTTVRIRVYDSTAPTLLGNDLSKALGNGEYGVDFGHSWVGTPTPVRFVFSGSHSNVPLEELNGDKDGEFKVILYPLPASNGGQAATQTPTGSGVQLAALLTWARAAPNWSPDERTAVTKLFRAYRSLLPAGIAFSPQVPYIEVLREWRDRLSGIGADLRWLNP